MSTKELYFASSLTVGLGPGLAAEIRAGEVLAVPGELVATLLKRANVTETGPQHSEARRVSLDEARARVPKERAVLLSPPLDVDRLLADRRKQKLMIRELKEMDEENAARAKSAS